MLGFLKKSMKNLGNKIARAEFGSFNDIFDFLFGLPFQCLNVRTRFFNADYVLASKFLRFCIFVKADFFNLNFNVVDPLFDYASESQFVAFLIKYVNFSKVVGSDQFDGLVNSPEFNFLDEFWVDEEFDWLIFVFLKKFCITVKFQTIHAPKLVSKFKWWNFIDFSVYQFTGLPNPAFLNLFQLSFDYGRKFFYNVSIFAGWQLRKGSSLRSVSSFVNSRYLPSFQIQFSYSEVSTLNFHVSNFRHIHLFNPIFREMYNVAFLIPSLRPTFSNLGAIQTYNSMDKLHYAGVYLLRPFSVWECTFDKYLYDHARLLVMLPDRYWSVIKSQYLINFAALNYSMGWSGYSTWTYNYFLVYQVKNIYLLFESHSFTIINGYKLFDVGLVDYQKYYTSNVKQELVRQIVLNCWHIFSYLQEWFESVNYFFFRVFSASSVTSLYGYHDMVNIFFGLMSSNSFDRITRRVLFEFSKFLYSNSSLVILFLFYVSYEQRFYFDTFKFSYSMLDGNFSNTLTELEIGYHNNAWSPISISVNPPFIEFGSEIFEQFYDYELWLYVYFASWYKLKNCFRLLLFRIFIIYDYDC